MSDRNDRGRPRCRRRAEEDIGHDASGVCDGVDVPGQLLRLAWISHRLPTAAADLHASHGRTPSDLLNILSSMPAKILSPKRCLHNNLHRFATHTGENCGLKCPSRMWGDTDNTTIYPFKTNRDILSISARTSRLGRLLRIKFKRRVYN